MSNAVPTSPISKVETFSHKGFRVPDPFAPRQRPGASFVNAILATALFRCWHHLLFFAAWATLIAILNNQGHKLFIQTPLLTVLGTVLGFVISYRTTSSFERYNEGRRLWSQIILSNRTFSRTVWFHVPDRPASTPSEMEEIRARSLVEKKTVINLLEAFAVAVKHYLRGEDGIYYQDLYYLVKFLPAYRMPAGMPSQTDLSLHPELQSPTFHLEEPDNDKVPASPNRRSSSSQNSKLYQRNIATSPTSLPLPVTSPTKHTSFLGLSSPKAHVFVKDKVHPMLPTADEAYLMPASNPPRYTIFDLFPFSLLIKVISKTGREVQGKKAARLRAKMLNKTVSHNIPLEISLYLSSYIAALQARKVCDVPTYNVLFNSLNQLVDGLTGLERILTTPVPFSYSIHLWATTIIYCLALPFQIWQPLGWVTIPATIIVSFIFFGFLVAGEEIENPFGYDKNDLNLDHFTNNIIRNELKAVTSAPPPDPAKWAFTPENNLLFAASLQDRTSPAEWVARGPSAIRDSLGHF